MIIVLHGRGGNGIDSTTCQKVREYLNDEVVVCPSYDSAATHSEIAFDLENFVNTVYVDKSEELIFVGCSMGGYWARYLANRFNASKLIMLNPSLNLYEEGVREDLVGLPITVFVGLKDEVVDPQYAIDLYWNRGHVMVLPEGDHRLHSQFEEILPLIKKAINTYAI